MPPTLYEELDLKPDCTSKDIRSAFIKLSKLHHPDTNALNSTHSKFVKINEAYSVLSKRETRLEYDITLKRMREMPSYPGTGGREHHVWRDDSIFHPGGGDFRRAQAKPYYGIKGLNKVSNKWIVWACVIFAGVGVTFQVLAIQKSFAFSREILDRKSLESYKTYQQVRERASVTNREQQIEHFKQSQVEK